MVLAINLPNFDQLVKLVLSVVEFHGQFKRYCRLDFQPWFYFRQEILALYDLRQRDLFLNSEPQQLECFGQGVMLYIEQLANSLQTLILFVKTFLPKKHSLVFNSTSYNTFRSIAVLLVSTLGYTVHI